MTENTAAGQVEVAPFEMVHEAELASAASHLEKSREITQEAHAGKRRPTDPR